MAAGAVMDPPLTVARTPLFRGYALVAFACAWLLGDWLSGQGVLSLIPPLAWLGVAGAGLGLSGGAALGERRLSAERARRTARVLIVGGALLLWLGLGAARAAWSNPARDPQNVARLASGAQAEVTGLVVAEPDERDGYRLLTVRVSQVTLAGYSTPTTATGQIEATVYGPNDWFAPTYGDTVSLVGALKPAT
ncbi:MAG: DUF4131 domain-containing protein, partial [Chloroflexota bacterium]|nr:DUF4131 domain-containing protein [Chloroflexota bacterium]